MPIKSERELYGLNEYGFNDDNSVIICDLDGTLAINNHGRDYFDATDCDKDAVNLAVLTVLRWALNDDRHVIFVSGREERFREPTLRFLERYLLQDCLLLMRKNKDNRPDHIIKQEIYEEHIMDDKPDELQKIKDKYNKPTILISLNENKVH